MGGWLRLLVVSAMVFTTSQWLRNWEATAAERQMALPGDELIGDPAAMTTLAVPIEAAAADIWPWLLQIGQDRAPQGWMGQPDGLVLPVARIEAPRSLVLRES